MSSRIGTAPGDRSRDPPPSVVVVMTDRSSLHLAASLPAQISSCFGKSGSPRYSLMLSFVTATGSSSTDGTSRVSLLTVSSAPVGSSPLASEIASAAAASASFLIAL